MNTSRERADEDIKEKNEICEKIQKVSDIVILDFKGFKKSELKEVKFYLIRNNNKINEVISNKIEKDSIGEMYIKIPFSFLKTDEIVIEINNKLFYKISDFNIQTNARELWTGMGYNGLFEGCECVLSDYKINNNQTNVDGLISKKDGAKNYILTK